MKLAFELVYSVKQIAFLKEGDHHSIYQRSEQNKRQSQEGVSSFPIFFCSLLELEHLASSFPALRLRFVPSAPLVPIPWTWFELRHWLFRVSSLQMADNGTLQAPYLREPSPLNQSISPPPQWFCFSNTIIHSDFP